MASLYKIIICLLFSHFLAVPAVGAEPKRNWVLLEEDVLSAREDLYIDINFREQITKDAYLVAALSDARGESNIVEIFGDDGMGNQKSVFLNDKRYRSIINFRVFSCKEKKFGPYLTLYRSESMGRGKTIYRSDDAEDRGSRGYFIPMMPLMGLPGEAKLRRFACTGRL